MPQEAGKTAVLVERIINKAINENIDIDKLLVVTFTNAAASEMRERVLNAIYKKLDEEPENENLQRQITLLNMASICTIDSFCLDVVKNNFYELENVSPNFRIADTPEIELLKQEILDELFENKYLSEDKDFTKLVNTYTSYRDDTPLKELILSIYNYINSSPYPLKWLDEKIEMFNIENELDKDFSQTPWGEVLLEEINEELIDDIAILTDSIDGLEYEKDLDEFKQTIESDIKQLTILQENLNNWDKSYEIAQNIKFITWPRKKVESEIKDEIKKIRDNVKKKFNKKLEKIFVSDSKQSNQDIFDMYDILKKLKNLIIEFDEIFSKKKRDKNIVDFTDIEHFALNILVKGVEKTTDKNGLAYEKIVKTDVAKKYTEKFEEIAIDEYQDSNLVQEFILSSISRGNNMFMVGDVKQSIYRFRQAMPKLFLEKYSNYETVGTASNDINGRKIQLFKNFRSRDNVLDFTNLIFKNIMSEKLGEVDYNEDEYLNFGAEDYKKINQSLKTEIDIIDLKKEENLDIENTEYLENGNDTEELEHLENIEIEAKYVANKIKKLIDSKYQVYDRKKESFRDITYKDIAILLRSTKDKASIYEQELIKLDMPVFSDSNQEYLDSIEIQTIMSLLKIIDNPMQDIPLVTVLRSNIGKFTDNELVEIRLSDKYENFYNCMQKAKVDVNSQLKEKIGHFLNQMETWRKEQEYLALDELIWKIYSDTGYYNYVGLMPNGNLRQANLKMLFERAKKYETASFKGLYNFINFIEKLKINSGDLSSAKIIGENDDVIRIMSIHKSKGLEFPVVFLVNTNKQFNEQDIKKNPVLLHQELGIGAKYINYNAQVQYDTLTREAIKNVIRNENISEEMRILYVALTRAKEKLIITGISNDYAKQLENIEQQKNIYAKKDGKINPILVKKYKTYLDWILLVYLYEQANTEELLKLNRIEQNSILEYKMENDEKENTSQKVIETLNQKIIDKNKINKIKEQIEYEYPNKLAIDIPTKSSVTKIKQMKNKQLGIDFESLDNEENVNKENSTADTKNITFEKPKFLQEEKDNQITNAQKGTLTHLCLQKLKPKKEYNLEKIQTLIQNLEMNKIITEKEREAINPYKILQFTKSKIWEQLKNAKEYYQERPFYINVPASKIYNEDIEENVLVQGIIDLYFVNEIGNIVLVDYKTDYVENGKELELVEKYKNQLELYKQALEEALNTKVDKVYIYSVYLEKEIEI
ncbi:MAG: helicase-exonuclease AddAB subunit AddA [Clostridia bacterium]